MFPGLDLYYSRVHILHNHLMAAGQDLDDDLDRDMSDVCMSWISELPFYTAA